MKNNIFGNTLLHMQEICKQINLPSFNARQICDWIYKKHVYNFADMTNLAKKTRLVLEENYACIPILPISELSSITKISVFI